MGKSSGKSAPSTTNTIQNSDPWSGQQPFLTTGYNTALANLNAGGPQPFPDQTVVPFSPQTEMGLQTQWDRGAFGSPVTNAARGYTQDVIQGDYLNSNPWLDKTFNRAADAVAPYTNAAFSLGGRTGSMTHQDMLGRNLNDLATTIYGGAYDSERNRQQQAMAFSPQIQSMDYQDIAAMQDVGARTEQQGQAQLNDRINRWNATQNLPRQNLMDYISAIQGNVGSTGSTATTATTPTSGSPIGGAIGGGLMGAMAAPQLSTMLGLATPATWPFALGGAALGLLGGL